MVPIEFAVAPDDFGKVVVELVELLAIEVLVVEFATTVELDDPVVFGAVVFGAVVVVVVAAAVVVVAAAVDGATYTSTRAAQDQVEVDVRFDPVMSAPVNIPPQ